MSVSAKNIRNIAIVGHSGEGKTALCEAILFNGGAIERMGRVDTGTTVSDFDEQEIARKMSISLSMAYTMWDGVKLNLLDVPGFYDFEGERNQALRAAGGALGAGAQYAVHIALVGQDAGVLGLHRGQRVGHRLGHCGLEVAVALAGKGGFHLLHRLAGEGRVDPH